MASPDGWSSDQPELCTKRSMKCSEPMLSPNNQTPVQEYPTRASGDSVSTHFFIDASSLLDDSELSPPLNGVAMPMPGPRRYPPDDQVSMAHFHKELSFEEPARPRPADRNISAAVHDNASTADEHDATDDKLPFTDEDKRPPPQPLPRRRLSVPAHDLPPNDDSATLETPPIGTDGSSLQSPRLDDSAQRNGTDRQPPTSLGQEQSQILRELAFLLDSNARDAEIPPARNGVSALSPPSYDSVQSPSETKNSLDSEAFRWQHDQLGKDRRSSAEYPLAPSASAVNVTHAPSNPPLGSENGETRNQPMGFHLGTGSFDNDLASMDLLSLCSESGQPLGWSFSTEMPACPPASLLPVNEAATPPGSPASLRPTKETDGVMPFDSLARVLPRKQADIPEHSLVCLPPTKETETPEDSPDGVTPVTKTELVAKPISAPLPPPAVPLDTDTFPLPLTTDSTLPLQTDPSPISVHVESSPLPLQTESSPLPRRFVLCSDDASLALQRQEQERRQGNLLFQSSILQFSTHAAPVEPCSSLPPPTAAWEVDAIPAPCPDAVPGLCSSLPAPTAAWEVDMASDPVAPEPPASLPVEKKPCGFFIDLSDLPSPEAPPPPPRRADAKNALFSMFIDIGPPTAAAKPRPGKPPSKDAAVSPPAASQAENEAAVVEPIVVEPIVVQPGSTQHGVNQSDEAKAKARLSRDRPACVSDSDSPLPRRRAPAAGARLPGHRHSWNPHKEPDVSAASTTGPVLSSASTTSTTGSGKKHRRAHSLSHSLTEDTSSSLSLRDSTSLTLGSDLSSRTFSASSRAKTKGSERDVSIISDTISDGRMITEEDSQDLTDVDDIVQDSVPIVAVPAATEDAGSFVKLSDMDKEGVAPARGGEAFAAANRMTRSIPESSWLGAKAGMTRSVGGCSRSLSRLFPHLMTSSAEQDAESELSDVSMQSSMAASGMEGSTEESGASPASRLGEDLLRMFLEEISPDVTLDVGGRRIRAHKCILASRCQYFAAVLSGGWVTSAGDLISLQGFSYNAVFFALCHIYSGTGDVPDAISLVELATLADMLALEGLKEVVSLALRAKFCHFFHKPCSVCSVGVVECLPLAAAYGLDDIYRRSLRWIAKHFVRIWPTKGFAALPRELVEKCYQQIVVHMTPDSVLETVLSADKLLATLPSARWAEPVFALASQLLDAAVRFTSHHFSHVLDTPSFMSLGREQSWNISRLEESLLHAADRLPPDQACLTVARLDAWLNAPPPTASTTASFTELLRRLAGRAEERLIAQASRAARAPSWARMPAELRTRVARAACLEPAPLESIRAAAPRLPNRSLTGSRHLDLRQVKLAMTQQARRAASGGRVSALTNDSRPRRQPVAVIHPRQQEPRAADPRAAIENRLGIEPRPGLEARLAHEPKQGAEPRVCAEPKLAVEPRLLEVRVNGEQAAEVRAPESRARRKLISSSDSSRAGSPALRRAVRVKPADMAPPPRALELDMSNDSLSSPRPAAPDSLPDASTPESGRGEARSPHARTVRRAVRAPLISPRESHTSRLRSAAAAASLGIAVGKKEAASPLRPNAKATPAKSALPKATPLKAAPLKAAPLKAAPLKAVAAKAAPLKATLLKTPQIKAAPGKAIGSPMPARALARAGGKKAEAPAEKALGSRSGTFLKDEPSVLRKPSAQ